MPLLNEYNCLHFKFSILLGISVPAYSEEELAAFKAEDNKTFGFEGKTYTKYEASQVQGALERKMVTQKELANMAKAAGDDVLRREAQGNINLLASKYNDFCKASGLPTRAERMNVSGFKAFKAIDKSTESGISGKRILNTSENLVDVKYISSKEYKDKFLKLPFNDDVCDSIYRQSRAILEHRKGTYFEDICLIDSKTGKIKARCFNNKTENEVKYTKGAEKIISTNPNNLIAIHNHGTNNPPTGDDFASAGKRKYTGGVVACHNGDVYYYQCGEKAFSPKTFALMVDNYRGKDYNYSEIEAIIRTLDYYSNHYGIVWRKL